MNLSAVESACDVEPEPKKTCKSFPFSEYIPCGEATARWRYNCDGLEAAFAEMKRVTGDKYLSPPSSKKPATDGPCPAGGPYVPGWHYRVRDMFGVPIPLSIGCCTCCSDSSEGPKLTEKCKII